MPAELLLLQSMGQACRLTGSLKYNKAIFNAISYTCLSVVRQSNVSAGKKSSEEKYSYKISTFP